MRVSEPGPENAESAHLASVSAVVDRWRSQLGAVGGPNSLLWDTGAISRDAIDLTTAHPAGLARLLSSGSARLSELFREPASRARVAERAQRLAGRVESLREDFGLHTGYLVAGVATWSWPGAQYAVRAPVLVRSCTLRRVGADLALEVADRVELNPVFTATLRTLGVDLDEDRVLQAVRRDSPSDPRTAYDVVRQVCSSLPGFRIEPRLLVGCFTSFKLPLQQDLLSPGAPEHPVLAALAGDPEQVIEAGAVPPPYEEHDPLHERLAVDLDSAQQEVIDAVLAGANLCVRGAAGTGKTHTAAALVAAMAAQGRRVLYAGASRASVRTVRGLLADAGLPDLVLDLGEHPDSAHEAGDRLREVLRSAEGHAERVPAADTDVAPLRRRVQAQYALMHAPLEPWGVTVGEAQEQLTRCSRRTPPPRSRERLAREAVEAITEERRGMLEAQLRQAVEEGAWQSAGEPDAWYGARIVGASQSERAHELVGRLSGGGLQEHRDRVAGVCVELGLSVPTTLAAEQDLLELLRRVHQTLEVFTPEIFDAALDQMVAATSGRGEREPADRRVGTWDRRRLQRQARALLRPGVPPHDLHGVLVRAWEQQREWQSAAGRGSRPASRTIVPELSRRADALAEELAWLGERLDQTPAGGGLVDTDYDALRQRLQDLAGQPDRLSAAAQVLGTLDRLRDAGLGPLLADLAARHVDADTAAAELEFVWWASIVDQACVRLPGYDGASGEQVRADVRAYAEADERHLTLSRTRLQTLVAGQRVAAERDLPDQVGVLDTHEGSPGELLRRAPDLTTALAPCWASAPLAVPGQVPPGVWFDAVVFDDASALPVQHAVPAIARAGQVVVLGDPHGAFAPHFPLGSSPQQGETLLDRAAELFPVRTLRTHYRSADERLVGFAAGRVYDGDLTTFPSAGATPGIRLDVVAGGSDQPGSSPAEVQQVLRVVLEHVRRRPQDGQAVLTFGQAQADAISTALADAAGDDPVAARLAEDLVVRPADRAQGLVADHVVIAVGWGRDERGRVVHRLGPISEAGGERLVCTAMTRARRQVVVVSGVSGDDLDPGALRSRGALLLRDYLLYAASGGAGRRIAATPVPAAPASGRRRRMASTGSVLDRPVAPEASVAVSDAVADLARRLGTEGLRVHTAYGLGLPRIDLVVEDPRRRDHLLLAIETDGQVYADLPYARDRERIRPQQLRARGWTYERVLTRDLFRDPAKEVARLVRSVHAASARQNAVPGLAPQVRAD